MFSSTDQAARDRVVDELKKKIRHEKRMLESHILVDDQPAEDDRPYRPKKLSEVFHSMGF